MAADLGADRTHTMTLYFQPFRGKPVFRALGAIAFAVLAMCSSSFARQSSPRKIRILCLNRPLPAVAAQSLGIYARYGIEVEFVVLPGSDALRNGLAAGKGDAAFIAVDNAVAMVESAGADVVIVMGGESSVNELIVQPEIKSIKDLRGRKVLVDAPNTAYALELKKILMMNGLQPEKDYDMKQAGSTPLRLQAMKDDKENAGSIMTPPFSMLAKHAGFVSLGSVQKLLGADIDRGTFALRPWAREHADLLEQYLAGYIEGQRWLIAPSNRPQVVALAMKESNINEQIANEWYAAVVETGAYREDARFDVSGFRNNLKLRAEIERGKNGQAPAADKYYDLSYYRAALSKIK